MMSAEEILDFLDSGQEALLWLANNGRQHPTDARLTVFRSNTDWAVFVELPHHQAHPLWVNDGADSASGRT